MASGQHRSYYGSFYGTGADLDVRTVGFKPKEVELIGQGGLVTGKWMESMDEGLAMKEITAGTKSMTAAGEGVTPLSDGFRLGVDADLNVADELVHFVARG